MKVYFIRHSRALFYLLMPCCEVVLRVFVPPWLDKTKISQHLRILGTHLHLKINLQALLPILLTNNVVSCNLIYTYIPCQLAWYTFKSALLPNTKERLETRGVESPLEVKILDVKVDHSASFNTFNCKIKPCPILKLKLNLVRMWSILT